MKRGWVRVAMLGALAVVASWWINAAVAPPGWSCDQRVTGFDGWPARSPSLEAVLATVDTPDRAVVHDAEQESDDYVVRQYLQDGEIVQEVRASPSEGQWDIQSVRLVESDGTP